MRWATLLVVLAWPAPASSAQCAAAMPIAGKLSSGFGIRHGTLHPGVDLRAPIGSRVNAAASGTVVFAGTWFDYGLMVEIEHSDGSRARYAHLASFANGLRPGMSVKPGDPIATLGRTGRTTGPNLHVELRRAGRPVDPWPWLIRAPCKLGMGRPAEQGHSPS